MKTLTRNYTSSNGTTRSQLSAQAAPYSAVRVDNDVTLSIAGAMSGLFRRLLPDRYTLLVQAALRRRAYANLQLARGADDPEDRQLGVMWRTNQPGTVHWEVAPESPGSPENAAFTACGRHDAVEMRDPAWVHGLERDRPISCPHCKALLKAASDAL
jgi:hypothetical protein